MADGVSERTTHMKLNNKDGAIPVGDEQEDGSIHAAAVALGHRGGRVGSPAKSTAARTRKLKYWAEVREGKREGPKRRGTTRRLTQAGLDTPGEGVSGMG
jgi:hypothetical protein